MSEESAPAPERAPAPAPSPDGINSGGELLLKLLQEPSATVYTAASSQRHSPAHDDPAVAAVGRVIPFPPWPTPELRPFFMPPAEQSSSSVSHPTRPWPLRGPLKLQRWKRRQEFPHSDHDSGSNDHFPIHVHDSELHRSFHHQRNGFLLDNSRKCGSLNCEKSDDKFSSHSNHRFSKSPAAGARALFDHNHVIKGRAKNPTSRPVVFGRNRRFSDFGHVNQPEASVSSLRISQPHHQRSLNDLNRKLSEDRVRSRLGPQGDIRQMINVEMNGKSDIENESVSTAPPSCSSVSLDFQFSGSELASVTNELLADVEEDLRLQDDREGAGELNNDEQDALIERDMGALSIGHQYDGIVVKRTINGSRGKEARSNISKGLQVQGYHMRNHRSGLQCRYDIENLIPGFLLIYESLIPAEEEKVKHKQLLAALQKLVSREWPKAELILYGSCANSFGVSDSDIDICLKVAESDERKTEILLKLAEILESDNFQNVQALTRARVPVVKVMDPVTGVSCDICVNNTLAVVNTQLLHDYAQIDVRLRQLAFIVKHWARSRGVNRTYHGTLSSYAYVLMCINFLQQRVPAILPCLQEMEETFVETAEDIRCAYFDQVEHLHEFGKNNKESIAKLVWAFFDYWAFHHNYVKDVVSVRTGKILSKHSKDWTRRIGNDRHLICIEDPFEIDHDLGRVVDKGGLRVIRGEFVRAADIMQYDPYPNVKLFEPYF